MAAILEPRVMEVKGQMIHVPESSTLMFLGSPRVDKLEELMGSGLYLSDIPIHDATRDVILVGQQAKAQDGLNNRMDKLKATLEKTHQALEEEKRRTVDLLYSIFPGDVAQKLWQGESVPARKFDDVTMLFSDIVGFTAVCAQCTPMQVISMLNELYTIETIGDAYCVAGGLHQKIDSHAKPIALMALKMMELSEEVLTPDSKSIKPSLQFQHHARKPPVRSRAPVRTVPSPLTRPEVRALSSGTPSAGNARTRPRVRHESPSVPCVCVPRTRPEVACP
ncbi:guanylate cyclase soluble subunit alpha-2-like [Salvelinus sp. IW2-2015]|uniref:guanylate cyclase soluble subunit alpha-2-like n=1 Tax=Salvelinus sp. IW2-2015 TaxID=2691554 RepID=UPI0038D3806D